MAIENLIPDAILATSLAGTISAVQEDPDSPDANWLTRNLQTAAAKTFYFLPTVDNTAHAMQDGGTAPTDAAFTTGWIMSNIAAGNSANMVVNTERAAATLTSDSPAKPGGHQNTTSFKSPTTLNGTFSAGTWDFSMIARSVTAVWTNGQVAFKYRIYKGPNADGSGVTEITSGVEQTSPSPAFATNNTNYTTTGTVSLPTVTLSNEFLFVDVAVIITTAATGTGTTRDVNLRRGANSRLITPTFTPMEANYNTRLSFPTPVGVLAPGANLQTFKTYIRKKGTGPDPTVTISLYENNVNRANLGTHTISNTTGQLITNTWNANLLTNPADAEIRILSTNPAGALTELGAVRWIATTAEQLVRTATGWVVPLNGVSNRTTSALRNSIGHITALLGESGRTLSSHRTVTGSIEFLTSAASRVVVIERTAISWVAALFATSEKLPIQYARNAIGHVANLFAYATRYTEANRHSESHVEELAGSSERKTEANRTAVGWVEVLWGRSTTQIIKEWVRNAVGWVEPLLGVTERFTEVFRTTESSSGELSGSAEAVRSYHRTAIAYVQNLNGQANRVREGSIEFFPFEAPTAVISIAPKNHAAIGLAKRQAQLVLLGKPQAQLSLSKRQITVERVKPKTAELQIITQQED